MLEKVVKKAIAKGGKIIIPAFAIERTQELVYYFHRLFEERKIPEIPIYVDSPMATNATSIFQVHPECCTSPVSARLSKSLRDTPKFPQHTSPT